MGNELILAGLVGFCLCVGVLATRMSMARRQMQQVRNRLEKWQQELDNSPSIVSSQTREKGTPTSLLKIRKAPVVRNKVVLGISDRLQRMCSLSGWNIEPKTIIYAVASLFSLPILIAIAFDLNLLIAGITGLVISAIPLLLVFFRVQSVKRKFVRQLPEAIDLMVSVLRTGHSVPQAVKTVSSELPTPSGPEFKLILQKMNLGQPLSEAMLTSCDKYQSYELDLIRRAISIQSEIGGSLADLLEKTNTTLKQRIKLEQHVKVLTSQSRMTAIIVGMLPFFMAFVLNLINPGYMEPLFTTNFGNILLVVALILQVIGVTVMRKMSAVKV